MKKVSKTIIICMLITITLSTLFFLNKKEDKKIYQKEQQSEENKFLTLMIEKEAVSGKYEESSGTFFEDGYSFNESLSKCENGSKIKYNEKDKTVDVYTTKGDKCYVYLDNIQVKGEFDYTGNYEEYIVPTTGTYKIELWGASGGHDVFDTWKGNITGYGAYTSGNISLEKGNILYLYIGGKGADAVGNQDSLGGFNGGGLGTWDHNDNDTAGAGGGATDIRITKGEWNNFESLKSRIMVAAGGGGASRSIIDNKGIVFCGKGGGLDSKDTRSTTPWATQITGFSFGIGQSGVGTAPNSTIAGGGGGYYGGFTIEGNDNGNHSGSGGSSFISGHAGCVAIDKTSIENNIIPKIGCSEETKTVECATHYSNYKFENTEMIDGLGYKWTTEVGEQMGMPSPSGETEMGHNGNGYARINLVK